jgi:hypothetical protein
MAILELSIASGIDDVEVVEGGGSTNAATDARIGFDSSLVQQALLLRGAEVLSGATINSAIVSVTPTQGGNQTLRTKIRAEAADNPDPLPDGTTFAQFLALPRTTSGVDFDANNPGDWQADVPEDSPNIATVIQEITDRPGFAGRIHLLWDDDGSSGINRPRIYHFDLNPAQAPKVIVDYTAQSAQVMAASAIVAALNAGTFSQTFAPVRSYAQWQRPFEVAEAVGLQVDVVPFSPMADDLFTRGSVKYSPAIDIVIRKKFAAEDLEEVPGENEARVKAQLVDALVALLEEINQALIARRIGTGGKVVWQDTRILATYIPKHLRENHQYTGVIRLTTNVVKDLNP